MRLLAVLALALALGACLPYEARQLNAAGDRAMAERRYEQAISSYTRSLALAPGQEKVTLRLSSAKVLLRQIYVDRIYFLVDAKDRTPAKEFVRAWELSARLPQVDVPAARVDSIRQDLSARFVKAEPTLRKGTEPHRYYLALNRMHGLVKDRAVARTIEQVGGELRALHIKARDRADRKRRRGLALLHCAAAATFSARDTGLWNEVRRRRETLYRQLAIPLRLAVTAARGGAGRWTGGLRRRLPSIFQVRSKADLVLALAVRQPDLDQRETRSRHSAQCQVGTRREENPECPSLKRRADSEKRDLETARRAVEAASARCSQEQQVSRCIGNIRDAERRLERQRDDYRRLESKVSSCPRYINKPVFKTFFYERRTLSRSATVSAALTLSRGGAELTSRALYGTSAGRDTYGGGLGCARIASDPMTLASLSSMLVTAEENLLNGALKELWKLQREKATAQLAGSDKEPARLDALTRARLVDPTYKQVQQLLTKHLTSMWGDTFGLVKTTFD